MKEAPKYATVEKTDHFGTRTYYHYSAEELLQIFNRFTVIRAGVEERMGQRWVELLLRK